VSFALWPGPSLVWWDLTGCWGGAWEPAVANGQQSGYHFDAVGRLNPLESKVSVSEYCAWFEEPPSLPRQNATRPLPSRLNGTLAW
jgi:hypothetical protein